MAINFPSSPTDGELFTANGITYRYDSTVGAWLINADGVTETLLVTNTLTVNSSAIVGTTNLVPTIIASFAHANAAFDAANNAVTDFSPAFNQANLAYAQANTAYDAANNAVTDFSPAFIQANTARDHANAAFFKANTAVTDFSPAFLKANLAYAQANAAYDAANNAVTDFSPAFIQANLAYAQANAAFDLANNAALTDYSPAFNQANIAFAAANTSGIEAEAAFFRANLAHSHANAAFASSNTKLSASGGTITGNLSITGSLSIAGNAYTIDSETLRVSDPLIYLAGNNYTSDIVDIGFVGNYVNTTGQNVHTGFFRNHENKEYYIFEGYDEEPTPNHIDVAGNNFTLAVLNSTVKTSNLILGGANAIVTIGNAFSKANSALPNTSGVSFNGSLGLPSGNLVVGGIASGTIGSRFAINGGNLGTGAGNTVNAWTSYCFSTNADKLVHIIERNASGSSWETANHKLARIVDNTTMGWMKFGSFNQDLITFGEAATEYVRIDGSGRLGIGNQKLIWTTLFSNGSPA